MTLNETLEKIDTYIKRGYNIDQLDITLNLGVYSNFIKENYFHTKYGKIKLSFNTIGNIGEYTIKLKDSAKYSQIV